MSNESTSHNRFVYSKCDNTNNNTGKSAREIWPYAEPAVPSGRSQILQGLHLYFHVCFSNPQDYALIVFPQDNKVSQGLVITEVFPCNSVLKKKQYERFSWQKM